MRVVYFGSGEFAVPALRSLANSAHELVLVVTQPDRPAGRGKRVMPTPVAARAARDGLDAARCPDVNAAAFVERMRELRADVGIVAAFGQKLLEPVRSAFPVGCVNLHASLLPKHRGASPIAHAILAGDTKTGVTAFRLVDRMDAGPILLTRETQIGPAETCGELHDRLAGVACDALDATLRLLESSPDCPGEPQDESLSARAPKLSKADGCVRFDEPAEQIARRCRAMWPWPGARARYAASHGRGEDVTLCTATAVATRAVDPPGTITDALTVATGDGTLEIHALKPAGKKLMGWQDFVNGRRVTPGDRFEAITAD